MTRGRGRIIRIPGHASNIDAKLDALAEQVGAATREEALGIVMSIQPDRIKALLACHRCGKRVEPGRVCYVYPVCFACLPPPLLFAPAEGSR